MDTPNFKVLVRCFTYNQSKYITDSMNGFCMQQTDFPFICCIVDDASTDGEQDVIKQYVQENFDFSEGSEAYSKETDYAFITYARHKTNNNCYFAVLYLKENHYSNPTKFAGKKREYLKEWSGICKYEALCEGDDYWTDPKKLQKQVDYLDNEPSCGLCFTDFNMLYENDNCEDKDVLKMKQQKFPHEFTVEQWIKARTYVGPMTWVYRISSMDHMPQLQGPDGTFVWFAYFLATSNVKCLLSDTTAVYRYCDSGVTHTKKIAVAYARRQGMLRLQLQLIDLYVSTRAEELKTQLITDWCNENIKWIYLCRDKEAQKMLDEQFNDLSTKNKVSYFLYKAVPCVLNGIYRKHLSNKGYR